MNNEADKNFMNSIDETYLQKDELYWEMNVPLIKIYTRKSSETSKLKHYKKVKSILDSVKAEEKEYNLSSYHFESLPEQDLSLF